MVAMQKGLTWLIGSLNFKWSECYQMSAIITMFIHNHIDLVVTSCFQLLSAAFSCFQLLSAAFSCFQLLPAAFSCFQLLSAAFSFSFQKLLSAAFSFFQLLSAAFGCFWLLWAAFGCFWLLLAAFGCFQLLSAAFSCFQLLSAAFSSFQLLWAPFSCFELLSAALILFLAHHFHQSLHYNFYNDTLFASNGLDRGFVIINVNISCRIFDSFGNLALCNQSFCSTHTSPTLTTWSCKSRPLSWFPPPLYFRICWTRSARPLMSTSKHHLAPKCIFMYYRYLESRKAKFSSDLR